MYFPNLSFLSFPLDNFFPFDESFLDLLKRYRSRLPEVETRVTIGDTEKGVLISSGITLRYKHLFLNHRELFHLFVSF